MGQNFELEFEGQKEKIRLDCYGKHNIYASVVAKIVVKYIKKFKK